MKSTRLTVVAAAVALLVLITPAFAQSASFKVQVPFEFAVGKQTLPAGEYRVTTLTAGTLQLHRIDGPGMATFVTTYIGGGPSEDQTPRVIFHNYSDHYFLSEVWIDDVSVGHQLFASASEMRYAREGHQGQTTLLAKGKPGK